MPETTENKIPPLMMVAWEVTRRCNLNCQHCRAASGAGPYSGELSKEESQRLLREIAHLGRPVVILTGGEPLLREDIYELAHWGTQLGLRMVIAPNGTLLDGEKARRLKDSGIQRVSISLDGASSQSHDQFRQVPGAFAGALRGIEFLKKAGLEFQINTTITLRNISEIPAILDLAFSLGAVAHHIFLLVPTGRGKDLSGETLPAEKYEEFLNWFYEQRERYPLQLKATCAPHYYRILRQRLAAEGKKVSFPTMGLEAITRGCLGGISFCFIAYNGEVQPCGYLEVSCGNFRKQSLADIWAQAPVFKKLRDFSGYQGRCGRCEFVRVCGGCRARAYARDGNYLGEEPLCTYQPQSQIPSPHNLPK